MEAKYRSGFGNAFGTEAVETASARIDICKMLGGL